MNIATSRLARLKTKMTEFTEIDREDFRNLLLVFDFGLRDDGAEDR